MRRTQARFCGRNAHETTFFPSCAARRKAHVSAKTAGQSRRKSKGAKNGMRIAECTEKRIPFAIFAYCLSVVTEEEDKSSNSFCARILLRIAFITLSISLPSV